MFEQPSGSFAITEQGDLGLGLTPIDENAVNDDNEYDKKEKHRGTTVDSET